MITQYKQGKENMKKFYLILCIILFQSLIFANDAYFLMSGGQLIPTEEKDTEVEMQEEIINIVLEPQYYEISVDFFFYNYGETADLEIGFPFFCAGDGRGKISDFKCWTNDVETSFEDYPIEKEWSDDTELENAYVRNIVFPSREVTKTRISYKSTYGITAPSWKIAEYLYGTGSSWKNSIGKMTVRIQNNDLYSRFLHLSMPQNNPLSRVNDNTWESVYTNIEPAEYTASITIYQGDLFGDDGPRILQKNRFYGCRSYISQEDLFLYTKPQLRLIRNAIYAFNGYPFKSKDLKDFFETQAEWGWFGYNTLDEDGKSVYPVDINFTEDKLTDIEKHNIKIIFEEEQRRQ